MDDRGIVGFEHQKPPVTRFSTVHDEIIETDPRYDGTERGRVAPCETGIESPHETFFFEALGCALRHAGVEIPDVPAIGDRHVASIGAAVDEHDSVLAKQAVFTGIIDETRDEEILLLPFGEIAPKRELVVDLHKPPARMRSSRPDDERKDEASRDVARCERGIGDIQQLRARNTGRPRNLQARYPIEHMVQLVAIETGDELRCVEKRPRPARRRFADLAQRIAAIRGIGGDHDSDVVIGQR